LTANKIVIENADIGSLNASKINAGYIAAGRLDVTVAYISDGAMIANAIIGNAHISDLSADKITVGTISGMGALTVTTTLGLLVDTGISTNNSFLTINKETHFEGHVVTNSSSYIDAGLYFRIGGNIVINNSKQFVGGGGVDTAGTVNTTDVYKVDGVQVVGNRGTDIGDPAGGGTVDAEARAAIGYILIALRTHGLITTV